MTGQQLYEKFHSLTSQKFTSPPAWPTIPRYIQDAWEEIAKHTVSGNNDNLAEVKRVEDTVHEVQFLVHRAWLEARCCNSMAEAMARYEQRLSSVVYGLEATSDKTFGKDNEPTPDSPPDGSSVK